MKAFVNVALVALAPIIFSFSAAASSMKETYADVLGRPVKFGLINIEEQIYSDMKKHSDAELLDVDFTSSKIFDYDVFVISLDRDEELIENISRVLAIDVSILLSVALQEDFRVLDRTYGTVNERLRIVLLPEWVFSSATMQCKRKAVERLILIVDPVELGKKRLRSVLNCE